MDISTDGSILPRRGALAVRTGGQGLCEILVNTKSTGSWERSSGWDEYVVMVRFLFVCVIFQDQVLFYFTYGKSPSGSLSKSKHVAVGD